MDVEGYTEIPEKVKLRYSLFVPVLFTVILWLIKFGEFSFQIDLAVLGIKPRTFSGLIGIITAPLIHADIWHLLSNTFPLLILWTGTLYFYRAIAHKVFLWIWLISGIGVWIFARPAFHIGVSGLIYGLVCFIFFSGIIRRSSRLLALSLLVTFLYGGMVWGILPVPTPVSWESHIAGAIAGIISAIYFRNLGPQRQKFEWEDEDDDEDGNDQLPFSGNGTSGVPPPKGETKIRYIYKQKDKEE